MTGKENLEKLRRLNFDADQILEAKKQKKKKPNLSDFYYFLSLNKGP